MSRTFSLAAAGLAATVFGAGAASAYTSTERGRVAMIDGPSESVLVVRGAETLNLDVGAPLLDGDQVFTRSNGVATLAFTGCTRDLAAASSLVVSDNVCLAQPIVLQGGGGAGDAVGGGGGAGAAGARIGLGGLVAGGLFLGVALAIATDDDDASG